MKGAAFIVIAYIVCTTRGHDISTQNATKQEVEEDYDLLQPPSKIKATDAIKILKRHNNTHPEESAELIKRLQLLMDTYNVTELYLYNNQSNVSHVSGSHLGGNSTNVGRERPDGYYYLKQAIVSHWSFTTKRPTEELDAKKLAQSVKDGIKFREEFLAKHRINLSKPIPKRYKDY